MVGRDKTGQTHQATAPAQPAGPPEDSLQAAPVAAAGCEVHLPFAVPPQSTALG